MRCLIPVLLAVVLAAPASAQTPLSATFTSTAGFAITNDKEEPYVTTARINGSSNEVCVAASGTLYFRVLRPDVLGRTIKLDFSRVVSLPWEEPGEVPCMPGGGSTAGFGCAPPTFLPGLAPTLTYSVMTTAYEWEFLNSAWRRKTQTDRRGNVTPVYLNLYTPGAWKRYAVLNWSFKLDEGAGDQYIHWLIFGNTWDKALNEPSGRVGIVAVTRVDDSTWVVRPISPINGDPPLPGDLVDSQAYLTRYVLASPDNCVPGTGGSCHLGDYVMPFELTLKKVPKVR
jgi:hypothetical protein